MIAEVEWSRRALRDFTIWLAGFIRDETELRAQREFHLDEIENVIKGTDGYPPGSRVAPDPHGDLVVWEYVSGAMWLTMRRQTVRPSLIGRLLSRREAEVVIVTAIRRPPTPQEFEGHHG
jgi:hypothetical protein